MQPQTNILLSRDQWADLSSAHLAEVQKWTNPCRARRGSHQKHPVFDFLFTYYPFSLGRLEQWHPGLGIALEVYGKIPQQLQGRHYKQSDTVIELAPETLTEKEVFRLKHIHNLLVLTQHRPANFSCYGMHEWAMVYQGDRQGDIRHRETASLRLPQHEVDHLVETRPICCSHFDAVRFFAKEALPFNKLDPTLDTRADFEQPGCLHSNMDLYKWASKCMPWLSSDLLWRCFQLALKARELDMRASAYDLQSYGYSPIPIETPEGRQEYEKQQRHISELAIPLRQEIIDCLADLLKLKSSY